MKKLLVLLIIMFLTGCQPTVIEKEVLVEVEVPYYIETEVIVEKEVIVEVIPEGYVDVYNYCHEYEVEELLYDLLPLFADDLVEYNPDGYYDGIPSIVFYDENGVKVDEIDIWDMILAYCAFEDVHSYETSDESSNDSSV